MKIYLEKIKENDYKLVDIEIEAIIPLSGSELIFFTQNEVCGLSNGKESSPYDEYVIKKAESIIIAKTKNNPVISLQLVMYFHNRELNYYILNNSDESGEYYFKENIVLDFEGATVHLINYDHYLDFIKKTDSKTTLSYKQYVKAISSYNYSETDKKLYRIYENESNELISNKGFIEFLKIQEE